MKFGSMSAYDHDNENDVLSATMLGGPHPLEDKGNP